MRNQIIFQQLARAHSRKGHAANRLRIFFSGESWRYKSIEKTLSLIADSKEHQKLVHQAKRNMENWQKTSATLPDKVEIVQEDWGTACLTATEQYGGPYTVLNHANARFPGGGFLRFGNAQEENMWHRSDCALSLDDSQIKFDSETDSFYYDANLGKLVSGDVPMLGLERKHLSRLVGYEMPVAHKVYFGTEPRICFRGSELLINRDGHDEITGKNTIFADPDFSFQFLAPHKIFPFFELRSAAPAFTTDKVHWQDSVSLERYQHTLRRCIAAQLDTLIINHKTQIILGAWGCGEFHNNPNIVASIYREEISKRAHCFRHIVFAILRTASHHHLNHTAFQDQLADLPLGAKATSLSLSNDHETVRPGLGGK